MKKPLFVFEMANNHMGDVKHGIRIIQAFKTVKDKFKNFDFAFKLQLRDRTIIHPQYQDRLDIKQIKRFIETRLSQEDFAALKGEIAKAGFITMCTPFDEEAVATMNKMDFEIYKIASCSFGDWPLMEKVAAVDKPIILSTGGAALAEMDNAVVFFKHREKDFCLLHCVTAYPTQNTDLQLNQIDLMKDRYEGIPIGFSTHEAPDCLDAVRIAVAKGAMIFEKHVGLKTPEYALNGYSAEPGQIEDWLNAAAQTFEMCGIAGERMDFTPEAREGVRSFIRGVYASKNIKKGERIKASSVFLAIPNVEDQILAKNLSKYTEYTAQEDIALNAPVLFGKVSVKEQRTDVYNIVKAAVKMLKEANVAFPNGVECSISAHYGIENFYQNGMVTIDVLNREYCKKLLVMFPGQKHPAHSHKVKEETFHILSGDITVNVDGREKALKKGDLLTLSRGQTHSFSTKSGVIIEEISTTHIKEDSYYEDSAIMSNENRKIEFSLWLDIFEDQ